MRWARVLSIFLAVAAAGSLLQCGEVPLATWDGDSGCPDLGGSDADSTCDSCGLDTKFPVPDVPPFDGNFHKGDWGPVPGLEYCGDALSKTPAIAAPAFKWKPCASGRAGCRQLIVDWVPDLKFGQFLQFDIYNYAVKLVAGKPYVAYRREAGNPVASGAEGEWLDVVAPLEGDAIFAFRANSRDPALPCTPYRAVAGEFGFGILAIYEAHGDADVGRADELFAWTSWSAPDVLRTKHGDDATFGTGCGFFETTIGPKNLFMSTNCPEAISLLDLSTGALVSARRRTRSIAPMAMRSSGSRATRFRSPTRSCTPPLSRRPRPGSPRARWRPSPRSTSPAERTWWRTPAWPSPRWPTTPSSSHASPTAWAGRSNRSRESSSSCHCGSTTKRSGS